MGKLSDLLAQQEKLKQQIIEASEEEIRDIKQRLASISEATGKSIPDLLNLTKENKPVQQSESKDADKEFMSRWRKDNAGKKFRGSNGKVHEEGGYGRYPAWLLQEIKAGTLEEY